MARSIQYVRFCQPNEKIMVRHPMINRTMKVNPPRILSLSKWRGKEVWQKWLVQTTSERPRRQMNSPWQCWAPLGLYKWLPIHLPLVVCVCMVFNECFTHQDSSITNERRTVFCYCSHMPDTKLCILYWKSLNADKKKAWFPDNVCGAH